MKEKKIKFRDPVVERVVDKFITRSDVGYEKYKITLDSERIEGKKNLPAYLNDVQEELMDAILYLESARHCLKDEIEDAMYAQAKTLNENINNIHVHNEEIF